MILAVLGALAHPSGSHPIHHALQIELGPVTDIEYQVEVPATFLRGVQSETALVNELHGGLAAELDGQSTRLEEIRSTVRRTDHGVHVTLELQAFVPPGTHEFQLGNANAPTARALHRTTLIVSPTVDVFDSSLFVWDGSRLVRSESGRTLATPDARAFAVRFHIAEGPLERGHRWLQDRGWRAPTPLGSLLNTNRSTPLLLLGVIALGLLGVGERPKGGAWVGVATLVAVDLLTSAAASLPLALAALAFTGLAQRFKTLAWFGPLCLAASLDVHGATLWVLPLLWLTTRPDTPRLRGLLLAALVVGQLWRC